VLQFIPIWYDDLGFGRGFYGPLVTTVILAGAVGTLFGGALADRLGQRRIVVVSLALAIPALLLFAGVPGRYALLTGALFGLACDASLSVTLVMAQRLVPGRVGVTSGVILGLGFITGGVGVPITGRLADAIGIQGALMSLGVLCALGALIALTIPREAEIGGRASDAADEETHEAGVHGGQVAAARR
ncbi:MAG: MFS transporter, partial [Chloroflexota bacterium]|nr:MFS transporter [Chloroflexota bacterium]